MPSEDTYGIDRQKDLKRLKVQYSVVEDIVGGPIIAKTLAPPTTVLDVGCGTGQWLERVAQEYPDAELYGVDISDANFDTVRSICGNDVHLSQQDASQPFPVEWKNKFDVINMRFLLIW